MIIHFHHKPTVEAKLAAAAFNLATGWDAAVGHGDQVWIRVAPAECDKLTKAYTDHTTVT